MPKKGACDRAAVDTAARDLVWEVEIGMCEKGETIPAAPVSRDGDPLVGTASGDDCDVMGRVYAFDAETGLLLWEIILVRMDGLWARPAWSRSPS